VTVQTFDEVITGRGRCGAITRADAFGVVPDVMNVAKQVTTVPSRTAP